MKDFKMRLMDAMELRRITRYRLAKDCNLSPTTITNWLTGKTLPDKTKIQAVSEYMDVDPVWLLTGEGNMIAVASGTDKDDKCTCKRETRPRVPLNAAAGALTCAMDGVRIGDCEQIPVISTFPEYDFTMLIKGDSMYPRYESGDEIACRKINGSQFIQWGKVHVLDTSQGLVIKRIYDAGECIRCNSFNPGYPDFNIPKNEIYSISLVVGLLRL
ncbi:helix-turn-helix transcriptional regulator [Dysgonomonas sp. GY75]|uniref:XRE family transcriptional regulator n=1 Tax=Dysgonomonas sp. GY75 TaxID=2780419 RepID=UPI00188486D6|nr:S24 family peptidase [Dysgonomonas sp. GY75]MBF0651091.1 helix-turn-helix transcriptional regulator [Dysgonomonas sp. GY75]